MREHGELCVVREDDIAAVLALDAVTSEDYPGSIATRHDPLTQERARVSRERRGFAVFDPRGRALAVTYVDIDELRAETDFTVVDRVHRARGLGSAVKAASVLALVEAGVEVFRTGGSADNSASLAANHSVGYVIDEHWVTLSQPR